MEMKCRFKYGLAMFLLAIEGCASNESEKLCNWCRCAKDKSTWMPETSSLNDSVTWRRPDPNALLVNCSTMHASPFDGAYTWPDVPLVVSREYQAHDSKVPDVPVTRADFSSCGLSGGMRKFPSRETRRLRELSLSRNSISWIHSGSLMGLPALVFLDLSHNKLVTVPSDSLPLTSDPKMTSNLNVVLLNHNDIQSVPWEALLRMPKLEWLDLSNNFIYSIENGFPGKQSDLIFESIKVVILSHNRLTDLSLVAAARFPGLVELDLSWNDISNVPEAFLTATDAHFKNLSVLNLNGNPIVTLGRNTFVGSASLRTLSVSSTATLSEISGEAFDGLTELRVLRLKRNVLLSRLPKKGILRRAFQSGRWAVEEVDLSYNSLEYISEDFLPWKEIRRVNVQGNPWNCNCSLQWMLDSFMPHIYKIDSSLLLDLRCSKPKWLQGRRFVHWLDRSSGVYCGNLLEKLRMKMAPSEVNNVDLVAMGMSTGMITVLAAIAVIVVGLIITAIALQRRATRKERELRTQAYLCRNPRI